jgi:prepilin-type N-terminal cleavage/methylation domain-containing protein
MESPIARAVRADKSASQENFRLSIHALLELHMTKSSQGGFTLIELVVVIVILGILAAFAVPRFARLDQQARIASVRSLEGTLRSGATMARAMWITTGQLPAGVNMEGGGAILLCLRRV